MLVKKRDGSLEKVGRDKILRAVARAAHGLDDVDVSSIADEAYAQLYDGISTADIDRATVLAARSRIASEPNYSYLAARLLLYSLYRESFGHPVRGETLEADYRVSFVKNLWALEDRFSPEMFIRFDLEALSRALRYERDLQFKYLGIQTLYDRYLHHISGRRVETPQSFWMRVAMGLCLKEANPTQSAIDAYNLFSTFRSSPATPTLFNSGSSKSQLSSCFLSTVHDSIDGIYGTLHGQARLAKAAGGLGIDLTPLRGSMAHIKGTNGDSRGVIPWARQINDLVLAVNQGGRRPGAAAIYLEIFHVDILDFFDLKKNTGDDRRRCRDLNTAVWISDLFMKRVKEDSDWYLFSPDECPELHEVFGFAFEKAYTQRCLQAESGLIRVWKKLRARDVWKKLLASLKETGHPWITFKDPCNIRYSDGHQGVVKCSNLCTEVIRHTLPSEYEEQERVKVGETAVCTLGSVNLSAHLKNGSFDWGLLEDSIAHQVRLLDNAVDLNYYPTKESSNSHLKHRPIGLGVMGWMDVLHRLKITPDSDEANELSDRLLEFISYKAIEASSGLAYERGPYSTFLGSLWSQGILPVDTYRQLMDYRGRPFLGSMNLNWDELRWKVKTWGMRNGSVMAIAPTVTISSIQGCAQSIEPNYSLLYVNSTLSGEFTVINEHFVSEMKERGLWSQGVAQKLQEADGDVLKMDLPEDLRRRYRCVFDLDMKKLIDGASLRQKWVDQGQSFNIYYAGSSMKELSDGYLYAWELGLKTTYYLHSRAASRVEKSVKACKIGEPCESCQ